MHSAVHSLTTKYIYIHGIVKILTVVSIEIKLQTVFIVSEEPSASNFRVK
jgi:hypothetical protein